MFIKRTIRGTLQCQRDPTCHGHSEMTDIETRHNAGVIPEDLRLGCISSYVHYAAPGAAVYDSPINWQSVWGTWGQFGMTSALGLVSISDLSHWCRTTRFRKRRDW